MLDHASFADVDLSIAPLLLAKKARTGSPTSVDGMSFARISGGSQTVERMVALFHRATFCNLYIKCDSGHSVAALRQVA